MEIKNHQKITRLPKILNILFSRKYNCMNEICPKIDHKFYSNVTTYNQTNE